MARGTSVTPNEWPPSGTLSPAQTYGETLIALPNVWGVHDGRNVDAAILDDGFYSAHVDLAANVRDVGTNLIKSHGTTVAGVLAAVGNNGQGIAGVLWNAQVALYGAGISSLDAQLDGTLQEQRLNQIRQAAHNGRPTVLNFSYVSSQPKAPNYWAFKLLQARRDRKQLLLVAGAGNEQTDFGFDYPAALAKVTPAFHMCNVVAVAAVDSAGVLATGWPNPKEPGSNFGPGISLAAAGTRVYTTVLNSKYDYVNGTSEATPFATGIAALLLAKENNGLSEFQLRDLLIDGSRQAGGLVRTSSGAIASGNFNVLNAKGSFAAVELLKSLVAFGQEKVDLASFSNGLAVVRTVDTSSLKVGIDVIYSTNVGVSDPSAVNIITGPGSSPQSPRAYCVETNHVLQLSATATNIFHGLPGFADASLDLSALTPGDVIFVEVNHYNSNASLQNVFLDSHALNLGIQGLGKAAITPAAIYVLPR